MSHVVVVWGERYEVTVSKRSKTVWIATGTYMGKTIQVQGRSEGAAVIRWREAAEYRGNG
ncbi:MAG TPA: hypothetical protein VNV61_07965 [Steroidobacteraceae bacterium]|jgi:hypothetical protein|nr:hypothetical protein [Steroidobacteraceae bacterium]